MKKLLLKLLIIIMSFMMCSCSSIEYDEENVPDQKETHNEVEKEMHNEVEKATLNVGDTVKSNKWEITLTKAEFAQCIYPEDQSDYYFYEEHENGTLFCNLEFDAKNLYTDLLRLDKAVNSVVVKCGDYVYRDFYYYYDAGNSLYSGYNTGVDPLETLHIYVEVDIPEEAAAFGVIIDLAVAGEEYEIVIP